MSSVWLALLSVVWLSASHEASLSSDSAAGTQRELYSKPQATHKALGQDRDGAPYLQIRHLQAVESADPALLHPLRRIKYIQSSAALPSVAFRARLIVYSLPSPYLQDELEAALESHPFAAGASVITVLDEGLQDGIGWHARLLFGQRNMGVPALDGAYAFAKALAENPRSIFSAVMYGPIQVSDICLEEPVKLGHSATGDALDDGRRQPRGRRRRAVRPKG